MYCWSEIIVHYCTPALQLLTFVYSRYVFLVHVYHRSFRFQIIFVLVVAILTCVLLMWDSSVFLFSLSAIHLYCCTQSLRFYWNLIIVVYDCRSYFLSWSVILMYPCYRLIISALILMLYYIRGMWLYCILVFVVCDSSLLLYAWYKIIVYSCAPDLRLIHNFCAFLYSMAAILVYWYSGIMHPYFLCLWFPCNLILVAFDSSSFLLFWSAIIVHFYNKYLRF